MPFFFPTSSQATVGIAQPELPSAWRLFLVVVLCSFPAMVSPFMPFGPALRPVWVALSALAPLVFLLGWGRAQAGPLARQAWNWCLPWVGFLLAYVMVAIWHQKTFGLVSIQISRLLFGAVVYAAARLVGLRWTQLRWAVWMACAVYGVLACLEFWHLLADFKGGSVQAVLQAHTSELRIGLGTNPITVGNQMIWLVGIVVMTQLLNQTESARHDTWAALSALMGLMAYLLTFSRGPLLGLPIIVALALFFAPKAIRGRVALMTLALLVGMLLFWLFAPDNRLTSTIGELNNLSNPSASASISSIAQRVLMWELVIQAAQQWPIFGPGTKGVSDLLLLLPANPTLAPIAVYNHFHSDWLQPLAMGGLVLVVGQVSAVIALLRRAWGNPVLVWIVLAPLTFGLTDRVFHENNGFGFLIVAWALYSAAFDNESTPTTASA